MEDQPQVVNFEGSTHSFPADFSQTDISKALRQFHDSKNIPGMEKLGGAPPAAGAKPPAPEDLQEDDFDKALRKGGVGEPTLSGAISGLFGQAPNSAGMGATKLDSGDVAGGAKPFTIAPALAAAGEAARLTPGGIVPKSIVGASAGAGTYLGLHGALNRIQNYLKGTNDEDTPATDLAVNEAGGAAIKGLIKAGKATLPPTMEALSKLSSTFSQYASSPEAGKVANALATPARYIEDLFAPGAKATSISRSGGLANDAIADQTATLASRAKSVVTNPQVFARKIATEDLENAYAASKAHSNLLASKVEQIADAAPTLLPESQRVVQGPIQLQSTLQKAKKVVDEATTSLYGPTPDETAGVNAAKRLLDVTRAKFDPQTGELLSADPMGFRETWNLKQNFGDNTSWEEGKLPPSQQTFKTLFHSLNDDMESSIPQWDPTKEGINAWRYAKATVEQRNLTFNPPGAQGTTLKDIIDRSTSVLPAIQEILADPQKLQRALNASEVKFPGGGFGGGNTRNDLAAARLQQVWQDGFKSTGNEVNAKSIKNAFNDPDYIEQNRQLYSNQTASNINEFLDNAALTQVKPSQSWTNKAIIVRTGLALTPAILGLATGSLAHTGEIALGEIGMVGVGKMLSNPKVARGLINLISGKALGMSDAAFARQVTSTIQGVISTLVGKDGTRTPGTLDKGGQFTPKEQP